MSKKMDAEINRIVQVTNPKHDWFPCLVIVTELKSFGIMGYTSVPRGGDAFIRIKKEDYEVVGKAAMIRGDNDE